MLPSHDRIAGSSAFVGAEGPVGVGNDDRAFTPALGKAWLTPLYDRAIGLFTRERHWRAALVRYAGLGPTDRLVDVGSGTGSLLRDLAIAAPGADLFGIEPDPAVLDTARAKLESAGLAVRWHNGFLDQFDPPGGWRPNRIVSSLVLHQVPVDQKRAILQQMYDLLAPGGQAIIADYMTQDRRLMRLAFRATVQVLDGTRDTGPNADGLVERTMARIFDTVAPLERFHTPSGTISILRGFKQEVRP